MFNITPKMMAAIFWPKVKQNWNEDILKYLPDENRTSVNDITALNLNAIVKMFDVKRIIEIGTFKGRSTIAMAMDADEIHTCDSEYFEDLKNEKIKQYHMRSPQMLEKLEGIFDLVFLDGRLSKDDVPHLKRLCGEKTIICMDDFEGIEKGTYNAIVLFNAELINTSVLIYPGEDNLAVILPQAVMRFSRQ